MFRGSRLWVLAAIVGAASALPVRAKSTRIRIEPGPSFITGEEKAIGPDPGAGIEHGVILIDETQLNDAYGANVERRSHVRAKILSNEARDMADVEILLRPDEKITGWWGKTLLPDGTVLELPESELVEQPIARLGRWRVRAFKGALPGVVPGSVIDYGYTVKGEYFYKTREIVAQRRWPVRRFRYRWKPLNHLPAAYRIYGPEGLDVTASRNVSTVLVTARDLPPVPVEPYMPPAHEVRLSVMLYYLAPGDNFKGFWKQISKRVEEESRGGYDDVVEDALSGIDVDPKAPLAGKLEAAYGWIAEHVRNPLIEAAGKPREASTEALGSMESIDRLFIHVARRLGAEAHVVLAPDRTRHYWDTGLKTGRQFDTTLVAVRAPGARDEEAILVDPSSGLAFGEIPWWVSGANGLLADVKNPRAIFLPPADPHSNRRSVTVDIHFTGDGSKLIADWTSTAKGQTGLAELQTLSGLPEDEYQRGLESLCGSGPDTEVTEVEHSVIFPPLRSGLACTSQHDSGAAGASIGRYHLRWIGPWIHPLPHLPSGPRTHPVVFDFSRIDVVELTVAPPPGFRPGGTAVVRDFSGPYGKYRLEISRDATGYTVKRALALLALAVPAAEYDALLTFLAKVRRADSTVLEFERITE